MEKGEEKEVDAVLLLLLLAWIRGKAYTVVSTLINRIVEAIETRAGRTVARIATRRPLPSPSPVQRLDRWIVSTPSSTFFVRFSSVLERSGGEDRGPTPLPPPTPDRGVLFHLSIHPSVPLHLPPPRPCLSVSPGSGQRTRQAGQRT